MKILYLTHQYLPNYIGGTEIYLHSLVKNMQKAGHDTLVVTCRENPSGQTHHLSTESFEYERSNYLEISFNFSLFPYRAKAEYCNPHLEAIIADKIKQYQPDVIHVMHGMKLSGSALAACHAAKIPVIVTLCDFWFICPKHTLLKWDGSLCQGPSHPLACRKCVENLHGYASTDGLYDWMTLPRDLWALWHRNTYLRKQLLQAKQIIALSHFQSQMYIKNGYPKESIKVLEHGLEISSLQTKRKISDRPLRMGFIGSLVPFKGVHVLLEGFKRTALQIECHVFGAIHPDNTYAVKLRQLAEGDSRIIFRGPFAPHQFGEVLQEIDLLAVPSLWYENEPFVVKAALYCQIPLISSRIGSLIDMIEEGKNGWLVEPGNPQAWQLAIEKAARHPLSDFHPVKVKTIEDNVAELIHLYQ